MIHSELGILTQESLVKRVQRSVSVLEEPAKNMKDIFSFYLLSLVRFSLGGGNRPEHGTHLGLGQVWTGLNMCVLDGGVPLQCGLGAGETHYCFLFHKRGPEQVYIAAEPHALPRKWALLIRLRARQALVTYGLCKPM